MILFWKKKVPSQFILKPSANGHNIVGQQLRTLLNITCCAPLHTLLHVVGSCCAKFETDQTTEPTTQHLFWSLFTRSIAQKWWIRLNSSSNIVGPRTCITHGLQPYGLYPSHDTLQVSTFLAVVALVCMFLKKSGRQRTLQTCVSFSVTFSFTILN